MNIMYIKYTCTFIIKFQQFKYLIILKQVAEDLLSEPYLNEISKSYCIIIISCM